MTDDELQKLQDRKIIKTLKTNKNMDPGLENTDLKMMILMMCW